jgi:hypothetical protein
MYVHDRIIILVKRVTIKKLQKSHDENVAASAAEKRSLKSNIFSQKLGVGLKDAEPGSASFLILLSWPRKKNSI